MDEDESLEIINLEDLNLLSLIFFGMISRENIFSDKIFKSIL